MAGHVFISYSRVDRAYVDALSECLTTKGIPHWYDYEILAGESFGPRIQKAIDECAVLVAVLTPDSVKSRWVQRELSRADRLGKPMVPLLRQECALPIELDGVQYVEARSGALPDGSFVDRLRAFTDAYVGVGAVYPTNESDRHGASKDSQAHQGPVRAIRYAPGGEVLVTAGSDETVRLWRVSDGESLGPLGRHTHAVQSIACSPDGELVASAGEDHCVRIWSVAERAQRTMVASPESPVWSLDWSRDGRLVAGGCGDEIARVWRRAGSPYRSLVHDRSMVSAVAFAPDGRCLATAGADRQILIWSLDDGKILTRLVGHDDWISAVAYSPDGARIASASHDRTIRIWDPEAATAVRTLTGHTQWVHALAYSPDGRLLVSGGQDQTVCLWRVADGCRMRTEPGGSPVLAVAYAPDGTEFAAGCGDGTVRRWRPAGVAP